MTKRKHIDAQDGSAFDRMLHDDFITFVQHVRNSRKDNCSCPPCANISQVVANSVESMRGVGRQSDLIIGRLIARSVLYVDGRRVEQTNRDHNTTSVAIYNPCQRCHNHLDCVNGNKEVFRVPTTLSTGIESCAALLNFHSDCLISSSNISDSVMANTACFHINAINDV